MQATQNCSKAAQAVSYVRERYYLSSTLKRMSQDSQNREIKNTSCFHNHRGYKSIWKLRGNTLTESGWWDFANSTYLVTYGKSEAFQARAEVTTGKSVGLYLSKMWWFPWKQFYFGYSPTFQEGKQCVLWDYFSYQNHCNPVVLNVLGLLL